MSTRDTFIETIPGVAMGTRTVARTILLGMFGVVLLWGGPVIANAVTVRAVRPSGHSPAAFAAVTATPSPTPSTSLDPAAVAREFRAALNSGQLNAIAGLFADDAVVTGAASAPCPCVGKTAIESAIVLGSVPDFVVALGTTVLNAPAFTHPDQPIGTVSFVTQLGTSDYTQHLNVRLIVRGDKIARLDVDFASSKTPTAKATPPTAATNLPSTGLSDAERHGAGRHLVGAIALLAVGVMSALAGLAPSWTTPKR
jgi:hypothetical protein